MKLFLASYIRNPNTIAKLTDYIGGFAGKTIAYIPTANNGESRYEDWKTNSFTWQLVNTLGAKVTAVQLEDYKDKSVLPDIQNKDILWFAGGACGYLMYWIKRTQLDKYLPELLKTSLYVGSSAGSMITASSLTICDWYIGESEPGASCIPGLGFIDFDIYPHYEDSRLPEIKRQYKGKKMYLLKNGEEIIWEDGKVQLIGEERIIKT